MEAIEMEVHIDSVGMNDPILPSVSYKKHLKINRGIKLIGLRLYESPNPKERTYVKGIQKSLYGKQNWFYLNAGFDCEEDNMAEVVAITVSEDAFDSDKFLYSKNNGMRIGVSAIVGQNGTGKSTIIDVILRLLNNMSAAIQGENYVYSSAQHLHYIEDLYCALAVYINDHVEILTCKGRNLYLQQYMDAGGGKYTIQTRKTQLLKNDTTNEIPIVLNRGYRLLLNNWFYTIISNYSLYAYNYRDFIYEKSYAPKINKLWEQRNGAITNDNHPTDEDYYWTTGLFYKNDGYQTPIVMQPMRKDGYIDVAKVNQLAKRNLISLAFVAMKDSSGKDTFPFRCVNQTHHIVAFFLNGFKEYTPSQESLNTRLREPIIQILKDEIGFKEGSMAYGSVWSYCADKTLKMLQTYFQYASTLDRIIQADNDGVALELKHAICELENDGSHRTLKWRQCLTYIKYSSVNDHYLDGTRRKRLDDIWAWMKIHKGKALFVNNDQSVNLRIDDMIPPSLADITLWIVDTPHLNDFNNSDINTFNQIVPFEGLSSGERQIAYTIGDIIYHMRNIGSNQKDINIEHAKAYQYRYVNLFLDELEQYFHPDLQRRFIQLLVDAINSLEKDLFDGVNITMVTHSPFVLTDIPQSNILCLDRDGVHSMKSNSFAANIYDLFNDTFMLDSTTGELAIRKIEDFLEKYRKIRLDVRSNKGVKGCIGAYEMKRIEYVAKNIGDEYLREELLDMVKELKEWGACAV